MALALEVIVDSVVLSSPTHRLADKIVHIWLQLMIASLQLYYKLTMYNGFFTVN